MANRLFKNRQFSFEQDMVTLFAELTVGASGAVTSATGQGITSVTKETAAGQYTIVLQNKYNKLLEAGHTIIDADINDIASMQVLSTSADNKTIVVQFVEDTGVAGNAQSGAVVMIKLVLRNSSVS